MSYHYFYYIYYVLKHIKRKKMMATNSAETETIYDRESKLRALDETKAGVKGLVDAGIEKLPRIFVHEQHRLKKYSL